LLKLLIWDEKTGTNILIENLPVTDSVAGDKNDNYKKFEEIKM
jgi:hypothetical protein